MSHRIPHTVLAFYQDMHSLQAVELRRHGQRYEVLQVKSALLAETSWPRFAESCGLRLNVGAAARLRSGRAVAVALSSVGAMSFRLELPDVGDNQLADIVRLQSETRLPLPLDQMELGWSKVGSTGNQTVVTVAALRRQRVAGLLHQVQGLTPQTLSLDSEVLVTLATHVGEPACENGLVLDIAAHVTQLGRVENGVLSACVVLDQGRDDLWDASAGLHTQNLAPYAQEVQQRIAELGNESSPSTVHLLSGGQAGEDALVAALNEQGLTLQVYQVPWERLRQKKTQDPALLWQHRIPLGLALRCLQGREYGGLFHHLCRRPETKQNEGPLVTLRTALVWLLLGLIVLAAGWDVSMQLQERRLSRLHADGQVARRVDARTLQKTLAQYRPDLLDLLQQINDPNQKDIIIDSIHCERGQAVRVTGHTKKAEAMYRFEEDLLERPGIKTTQLEKEAFDPKAKVFNFTVLVHYKTFTKKSAPR